MNQLISVVIPVFNPREEYLIACLKSVFDQTYINIEVILINDGSKTISIDFINNFKNIYSNIKIIHNEVNLGVSASRNLGVLTASGNKLCFIDQDDFWPVHKIELQNDYLTNNPDCDFVTSRQRYFLSNDSKLPNWVKKSDINANLPGFLFGTLMIYTKKFGKLDEQLKLGNDDVDWFFRAKLDNLKHHEIQEELLFKRIHENNASANNVDKSQKELLKVVKMNLQRRKNNNE